MQIPSRAPCVGYVDTSQRRWARVRKRRDDVMQEIELFKSVTRFSSKRPLKALGKSRKIVVLHSNNASQHVGQLRHAPGGEKTTERRSFACRKTNHVNARGVHFRNKIGALETRAGVEGHFACVADPSSASTTARSRIGAAGCIFSSRSLMPPAKQFGPAAGGSCSHHRPAAARVLLIV